MRTSSKAFLNLAAVITLSAAFVPAATWAQDGSDDSGTRPSVAAEHGRPSSSPERTSSAMVRDGAGFCNRFAGEKSTESTDFDSKISKLNSDQSADASKRQAAETAVDQKVSQERDQADSLMQQHFTKLEANATTDAGKQAVQQFEATVQAAVTARRTAVDKARNTFRTGVKAAVAARQGQINQALSTYKAAVQAALTQAQVSCTAGTAPATVQQTLRSALQTAHNNLRTALQSVSKTQVSQLAATYKAAVQAANTTFKQAVQQAAAKLKAALGQTGESPSPSPSATP